MKLIARLLILLLLVTAVDTAVAMAGEVVGGPGAHHHGHVHGAHAHDDHGHGPHDPDDAHHDEPADARSVPDLMDKSRPAGPAGDLHAHDAAAHLQAVMPASDFLLPPDVAALLRAEMRSDGAGTRPPGLDRPPRPILRS